jgi:hypothetical protein
MAVGYRDRNSDVSARWGGYGLALGSGSSDPDGTGTDGIGMAVGSGKRRDGIPKNGRMKISTRTDATMATQMRARRSVRGARAPR